MMVLSRKSRVWLVVLGIPVVIIVGGVIVLKMLFTSERLKSFLIPKIEGATHRTVAVNSISLSVIPTLAVEVDGLVVSNKNEEGFSDKPMLQLDRLVLDVRLVPLLKGNVEVSTATMQHPQILLEVNEEGVSNYSEEERPSAPTAGSKIETKPEGYGLLLSNLQVVNGALEYIDRKGNSATTLAGMNHTVRLDAPKNRQEITIETQSSVEKFSYGSLSKPLVSNLKFTSALKMVYDVQKDILTLIPGTATIQKIPLSVNGHVAECTKLPVMNLVIESDKVSIPELLTLLPAEYMKKAEGVKGNGVTRITIEIKGSVSDSTNPDVTGMISATNASIQYAQLPKAITNVNIVADFTRSKDKQEFRITKLSATLGNNPLDATMTVVNFGDPSLTMALNASMNLAEVKDYYPLEPGTDLAGALKAKVNIAGKVSNPTAMKATGTMEFQGATIKSPSSKSPVENLKGTIVFNNQIIEAKKFSMNLGTSDLSLAFSVRNYLSMMSADKKAPKATASLVLTSDHLYTEDVMGEEKSPEAAASKPKSTALSGESTPAQSAVKGIAAKSMQPEVRNAGVPLPDVDLDVVATIGTLTMEKFELKNVHSTMKISNGIVAMKNFTCNVFDGSVTTSGTLNMQKPDHPTFDLTLDMNNIDAHAMLPKFTSFGERMFGKLSMTTTMKGSLNDTLGLVAQGLNGQGKVNVQEGKLTGVKVNQAIASMLQIPDVDEIRFKDWANAFTIADGRIHIKDLKISALGADYLVNGSQGLDGSLDYTLTMLLSEQASQKVSVPGFGGEAAKLFKEPDGRVKLDFAVRGTSDDPKVNLDTQAARKKAEDLLKQKIGGEAKKLEEKAGDVLKGLFKKKK